MPQDFFARFAAVEEKIFIAIDAVFFARKEMRTQFFVCLSSCVSLFLIAYVDVQTSRSVNYRPFIALLVCFVSLIAPKGFARAFSVISGLIFAFCFEKNYPSNSMGVIAINAFIAVFSCTIFTEICFFFRWRLSDAESDNDFLIRNFSPKDNEKTNDNA